MHAGEYVDRYLTEKEAAQVMGLSVNTLRNKRHLREGPSYAKLGRAVRYSLSQIMAYMESNTVTFH